MVTTDTSSQEGECGSDSGSLSPCSILSVKQEELVISQVLRTVLYDIPYIYMRFGSVVVLWNLYSRLLRTLRYYLSPLYNFALYNYFSLVPGDTAAWARCR